MPRGTDASWLRSRRVGSRCRRTRRRKCTADCPASAIKDKMSCVTIPRILRSATEGERDPRAVTQTEFSLTVETYCLTLAPALRRAPVGRVGLGLFGAGGQSPLQLCLVQGAKAPYNPRRGDPTQRTGSSGLEDSTRPTK